MFHIFRNLIVSFIKILLGHIQKSSLDPEGHVQLQNDMTGLTHVILETLDRKLLNLVSPSLQ